MQSKINKIQIYTKKGEVPHTVRTARVVENHGLEGDRHCIKDSRQISITSEEVLEWMKEQSTDGLCFRKFSANLILDHMESGAFRTENLLSIGEGTVLRVTDTHKVCFQEECGLFESGRTCRLQGGILFAEGVCSGQIYTGDFVSLKEAGKESKE